MNIYVLLGVTIIEYGLCVYLSVSSAVYLLLALLAPLLQVAITERGTLVTSGMISVYIGYLGCYSGPVVNLGLMVGICGWIAGSGSGYEYAEAGLVVMGWRSLENVEGWEAEKVVQSVVLLGVYARSLWVKRQKKVA